MNKTWNYLNLAFFLQCQQYLLPVMLPFYLAQGLDNQDYLFFQSLIYMFYLVFAIPANYISDHCSKKYILISGFALNLLRIFLWLTCRGYWIVLLGEILMVFIRLTTTTIVDSYIYEAAKEQNAEHQHLYAYGRVVAFMSYGTALASLTTPFLYPRFSIYMLLILEFIFTACGSVLLFKLPKTKVYNTSKYSLSEMAEAMKYLCLRPNLLKISLIVLIMYFATGLFVANFQPLMKVSAVPVFFFGFVYFMNQFLRGAFSQRISHILARISLEKYIVLASVCIFISMLLMAVAYSVLRPYFSLFVLLIVCVTIGMQLSIQVFAIKEIHKYAVSRIRATIVSTFNMVLRGATGVVLFFYHKISSFGGYSLGILLCDVFLLAAMSAVWYRYKGVKIDHEKE